MKLSIPCTWDDALLDGVCRLNDSGPKYPVFEFYGSLKASRAGSCHSTAAIRGDCFDKKKVAAFIKKIHRRGFKFNYTINSSCLGNKEFEFSYRKKLIKELEWIISICDSVTVAIPLLIEMVRELAGDSINIVASVINGIDSIGKIDYFEELGADRMVLNILLNRNLPRIKETKQHTSRQLELLVNDSCLFQCPFRAYHYNTGSHGSRINHLFYLDYCVFKCTLKRLQNPVEIVKSPWLRPEDLEHYREHIDIIKIAGREKTTPWVMRAVEAYAGGRYNGNILDLLTIITPGSHELGNYFLGKSPHFFLDNNKLGTFMQPFLSSANDCAVCTSCNYCETIARQHLIYDQQEVAQYAQKMEEVGNSLFSAGNKMNLPTFILLKFLFLNFIKDSLLWRKTGGFLKKLAQWKL